MRRWLLLTLLVLLAASASAQVMIITAVTAQIKDTNGSIYSNCQWSVVFVGQNPNPVGPYQPQNLTVGQQGTCDSFGNLNVNLADNINTITPTPSQWQFNICSAAGYLGGPYCFTTLQTVTGNTQNFTSVFTPLAPKLPTSGGGGTGCTVPCIVTLPNASQNIVQPPGTQFSANTISNIQFAETSYNWSQNPIGTLTGGSPATVTLSPCPAGIWGTDNIGVLYVSTVGTAEPVHLTGGGSCTPGAASGTINFTPVNSHGVGYAIGSASSGIYEAIAAQAHFGGASGNVHVILKPAGTSASNVTLAYAVQGTIIMPANSIFLDGQGAVLECATRDACVETVQSLGPAHIQGLRIASTINVNGWSIASTQCLSNVVTITTTATHGILVGDTIDVHDTDNAFYWGGSGLFTASAVTSNTVSYPKNCGGSDITLATTPGTINIMNAGFVAANQGDSLTDVSFNQPGGVSGHFSNQVVVYNDQEMDITRMTSGNLSTGTSCTSTNPYCGAAIYAPGPSSQAAVLHITQSSLSMNCTGNGVIDFAGNTMSISDTVIQGYSQVGILGGTIRGGFGPSTFSNVYTEVGACTNPNYANSTQAAAGLIQSGTNASWDGGEGAPATTAAAFSLGGATTYIYYLIVHDSAVGVTVPLYIGQGAPTISTQLIQWPRVVSVSGGTITYDLLRATATATAPTNANCVGGSTTACGSVALAQAQCAGLICSLTDDVTVNTTAYSSILVTPTFQPRMAFWPLNLLESNAQFFARNMNTGLRESLFVSTVGSSSPSLFCDVRGSGGAGNIPIWTVSPASPTSSGANSTFLINDAGSTSGLKGRFNISRPASSAVQGHIITLIDSDPVTTVANGINRPTATATDAWLGNDATSTDLTQNQLGIGGATAINQHIGTVPGTAWLEQLTATTKTYSANINIQAQGPFQDLASVSAPGLPVLNGTQETDNFNRANGSIGANWTQTDGTWSISSNQVVYTLGGDSEAAAVWTASSNTNDQYSQVNVVTQTNAVSGVMVRGSSVANTGYAFACGNVSGSCFIFKVTAGVLVNLTSNTGFPTGSGTVLRFEAHGTTLTGFLNGIQVLTTTDGTFTTGSVGMWAENAATTIFDNWRGGDLNYGWTGHTATVDLYSTGANCAAAGSAANPSLVACGAAAAGRFSCATNASTGTCVISTTAVTAASEILITPSAADGTALSVTCNTTADSPSGPRLAAKSAGSSFTINLGTVAVNPTCYEYMIIN